MQWILSVFAKCYNKRFKLFGHVWYDRFKSFILHSLRNFLETFVYIMENPVKAGIVKNISDFIFCGAFHMKIHKFDIIEPPDLLCHMYFPEISSVQLIGY